MHPYSTDSLCACGCGEIVKPGKRFIHGHNGRIDSVARFWSRVDRVSSPFGCWLWTGVTEHGYGVLTVRQETWQSHRYAWTLAHGAIPAGLLICHDCDRYYPKGDTSYRRCVRPEHLFLGTHADNNRDMREKGRAIIVPGGARDIAAYSKKLTYEQVDRIRTLYESGKYTQTALAALFNVRQTTISNVIRRVHWKAGDYHRRLARDLC